MQRAISFLIKLIHLEIQLIATSSKSSEQVIAVYEAIADRDEWVA